MNKNILKFFIAVIIVFSTFQFFGFQIANAAITEISAVDYCERHGHNEQTTCRNNYPFRDYYDHYDAGFSIEGHRHGSSYVSVYLCFVDTSGSGRCNYGFSGSGYELGPEIRGGAQAFYDYVTGGTVSQYDRPNSWIAFQPLSTVKDAEVRVAFTARAWTDEAPVCNDSNASNFGESGSCVYRYTCNSDNSCSVDPGGNYNSLSSCEDDCIPVPVCEDPNAINFGGPLPCVPRPDNVDCSPRWQTVGVGQAASFTAIGGPGGYTWWANDGNPANGSGSTFSTVYPLPDTGKTVRVYDSNGVEAQCYVQIVSQPQPPSGPDNPPFGEPDPDKVIDICMGGKTPPCPHQKSEVPVGYTIPLRSWYSSDGEQTWQDVTNQAGWSICKGSRNPGPGDDAGPEGFDFDGNYNQSCQAGYCDTCRGARFDPANQTTDPPQKGLFRTIVTNTNDCKPGSNMAGCKPAKATYGDGEEFFAFRIVPGPAGWIRCNGADDACSVGYGQSATITWQAENMGSSPSNCSVVPAGWTGISGSRDTGSLTSTKTYDLRCVRFYGSSNEFMAAYNNSVIVNVGLPPPPTVDIKANNSDGPITLAWNSNANLSWSSSNASSCAASGDWSGGKPLSGSEGTGNLTNPRTYNHTLTCTGNGSAQDSVQIVVSAPVPATSNVSVTEPNYCVSGPAATIGWTYSDPSGSPQFAYQVQIDDQGGFNNPEVDSGKVICGNCGSYFSGQGILQFNTTYRARVRVWNSNDIASDWTTSSTWKTPSHAYPNANSPYQFTYSPTNPAVNSPIQFTDRAWFDPSSNNKAWSWTFVPAGGGSGSSTAQNPSYAFNTEGIYQVTESVRDNALPSGQFCVGPTQAVNLQKPVPIWKEVAPR